MNRHLIWIIGGASVLGLGVPALAAARSAGTPDDNGVPGEVRGNCDEPEHAADRNCQATAAGGFPTITVTVPSTVPVSVTVPRATPDDDVANAPAAPTVPTTTGEDISGPCDELEHATDPRCTGVVGATRADDDHGDDDHGNIDIDDDDIDDDDLDDDHSSQSGSQADVDDDDDHSGRGPEGSVDDDHSGPGGGDDRSDDSGHDDSGHDDSDDADHSGHGGGDD